MNSKTNKEIERYRKHIQDQQDDMDAGNILSFCLKKYKTGTPLEECIALAKIQWDDICPSEVLDRGIIAFEITINARGAYRRLNHEEE